MLNSFLQKVLNKRNKDYQIVAIIKKLQWFHVFICKNNAYIALGKPSFSFRRNYKYLL